MDGDGKMLSADEAFVLSQQTVCWQRMITWRQRWSKIDGERTVLERVINNSWIYLKTIPKQV